MEEALVRLKNLGYVVGIATSKPEETARKILEAKGVAALFDEICGATMDGSISTKAEVLSELFRRVSKYQMDEVVLVGDTAFDVKGANAFGVDTIGVSFGFGDVEEMRGAGAIAICDSLLAVVDLLEG